MTALSAAAAAAAYRRNQQYHGIIAAWQNMAAAYVA